MEKQQVRVSSDPHVQKHIQIKDIPFHSFRSALEKIASAFCVTDIYVRGVWVDGWT